MMKTAKATNIENKKHMKKNIAFFLFVVIHLSLFSQRWAQQGEMLYGAGEKDYFGSSVSLNSDGNILAAGAYQSQKGPGFVKVFRWDGSNWVKKGNTLQSDSINDYFGCSVSLNADGDIFSVGAPYEETGGVARVYYWDSDKWSQKGGDIIGENIDESFGYTTCLSEDGNTLAVGGIQNPQNDSVPGVVRIYNWDGSNWVQQGSDIYGEVPKDNFGYALSWNFDATTLAVGAYYTNIGENLHAGQVRIYKWNGSDWVQHGSDIEGDAGYWTGVSVSLDSAGNTLGVGSVGYNGYTGMAEIFEWNGMVWALKGERLYGRPGQFFGAHVNLSSNNNTISIVSNDSLKVYNWNGSEWLNDGGSISDGENFSEVDFTGNGKFLALSNIYNGEKGSNAGAVRVYKLCYDSYDTISTSACYSFTSPGGKIWDTTGVYNDTITNVSGCDSIITINLTIFNATDTSFSVQACQSYTSPGGELFTTDSVFTETILNVAGCDSIITIDLTIFETAYDTSTLTKCVSHTSPSGKYTWTESGTYTDTVVTSKGCDSIVTIHLTINEVDISVDVSEDELTSNATFSAYQWLDCNDNYSELPGATRQALSPSVGGSYAVEVTASNGCVDTSACYPVGTSVITENNFGDALKVYPNPTTGKISIDLGEVYQNVTLELRNTNGKAVSSANHGLGRIFEHLIPGPSGPYLLDISTKEGKEAVVKIIKN